MIGRFVQPHSIGMAGGIKLYAYVGNIRSMPQPRVGCSFH